MNEFEDLLKKLQDERFVHSISELTYDKLFALWHLSPAVEHQLSEIISKVIIGLFSIKYLSHINEMVISEADLDYRTTSYDLSDNEKIRRITEKLSSSEKFKTILEKDILPQLIDIIENTKSKDLTELTRVAHAGDYLLSALNDLKVTEDPEYSLWIESIPEYYEMDLSHMRLKKRAMPMRTRKRSALLLDKWVTNLDQHTPSDHAVIEDGKVISIKPWIKERRRQLLGFNRRPKENIRPNIRMVESN